MHKRVAFSRTRASFLCAVVLWACALAAVPAFGEDDGFVPLFNGKDLSGWKGDPRLWSVVDGVLVGTTEGVEKIEHNTFLSTEKSYADFVLRAKVKLRNHNSGIQFRSEQLADYAVAGYQADVAEKTYFGMLYEEQKRGILDYWKNLSEDERVAINAAAKLDDWNEYEITCQGDHVKMVLNGKVTLDFDDPAGAKEGIIALQLHAGPPMKVEFKDISIKVLKRDHGKLDDGTERLMPDYDRTRTTRLGNEGRRFMIPDDFAIEELASNELIGSVINMTFDHKGRPVMCSQTDGIRILVDENTDGTYEKQISFCEEVKSCQGIHFLAPGDVLVNGNGPEGAGLYRIKDTNGDDQSDEVKLIVKGAGGMGEHGPHSISMGPDGYLYIMYGNHAHPDVKLDPASPTRNLQEDYLLPRYFDPRGHAVSIRAPGGGIYRLSPDLQNWSLVTAGFRNAYDMDINLMGEMFTFDSDMEWDVGMPWYRPIRVAHCIPGADYGWRTGSSNPPFYYIDNLPSLDDVGRGSPVGVAFYYAYAYPQKYWGAFFSADWSRGRIRVNFPQENGASYKGRAVDFVVGEPLNVTDLDVGPDGCLYFTTGGRSTNGGFYRVKYVGTPDKSPATEGIAAVLDQPMPRSAWGKKAITDAKEKAGADWDNQLRGAITNTALTGEQRAKALELLQVLGTKPDVAYLSELMKDGEPKVRANAALLLGTFPFREVRATLSAALSDSDNFTRRRVCEALVRSGLNEGERITGTDPLVAGLLNSINSPDRFLRYAARLALMRTYRGAWEDQVHAFTMAANPYGALEGVLALILSERTAPESDRIFAKLEQMSQEPMVGDVLLDYTRVLGLAFIRDVAGENRVATKQKIGPALLAKFPGADTRINRELQVDLAYLNPPGTIPALLAYLTPDKPQEEQIHTIYCLRAVKEGWSKDQRAQLVAWFDRGRTYGGGASFEGFVNFLWDSTIELLPEDEKQLAQAHMQELKDKRTADALALLAEIEGEAKPQGTGELAQMGFQELSEYLEYDPGAYRNDEKTLEQGKRVFIKARCANCHVFGDVGKGGGPDLSTVVSRFRRRDILEAIMYPSKVISDQYQAIEVELDDLSSVIGMLAGEDDKTLTLINVNGEKVEIKKSQITKQTVSKTSIMPEGLLTTLGMGELSALVNFLEQGGNQQAAAK